MEKKIENEMETGIIQGIIAIIVSTPSLPLTAPIVVLYEPL